MQFLNTLIRKIMRRYLEFSNSLTTFVRVMKQRVEEIDFLRCVLILLMITFHIVYIGDTYGAAKQFVYTLRACCLRNSSFIRSVLIGICTLGCCVRLSIMVR